MNIVPFSLFIGFRPSTTVCTAFNFWMQSFCPFVWMHWINNSLYTSNDEGNTNVKLWRFRLILKQMTERAYDTDIDEPWGGVGLLWIGGEEIEKQVTQTADKCPATWCVKCPKSDTCPLRPDLLSLLHINSWTLVLVRRRRAVEA